MLSADAPRIGLDLDNTIVRYDEAFVAGARALGLAVPDAIAGKAAVRRAVRALPDGERRWQQLQAHVYGDGLRSAQPYPGVREFVRRCRARGASIAIVSHKTPFAAAAPARARRVDLRAAARAWLAERGIVDELTGVRARDVHFMSTRAAKLARIADLRCTHFVDDLPEVLCDAGFPTGVARLLFVPAADELDAPAAALAAFRSWSEIERELLG